MSKSTLTVIKLLQASACCVFLGRGWQHLFWDGPYREFFWDAGLMKPLVEGLTDWQWDEYVTSLSVDAGIRQFTFWVGVFFLACALASLLVRRWPLAIFRTMLWIGAGLLVSLALLYMKEYFFHAGQFLEYALQFGSPVFLLILLKKKEVTPRLVLWLKIAIVLTFTCHGLYALNYYPRPGNYTEMTMRILGLPEGAAKTFLNVAGTLDFVVAVGIFLPPRWARWFLGYAIFWGFVTTLARIWGNFYMEFPWQSLHQWAFQTVYRAPHFLVPLAVLLVERGELTREN